MPLSWSVYLKRTVFFNTKSLARSIPFSDIKASKQSYMIVTSVSYCCASKPQYMSFQSTPVSVNLYHSSKGSPTIRIMQPIVKQKVVFNWKQKLCPSWTLLTDVASLHGIMLPLTQFFLGDHQTRSGVKAVPSSNFFPC